MQKIKISLLVLVMFVVGVLVGLNINNKVKIKLLNSNVVMSIKNHDLTSDEIYEELKSASGLLASLDMIDNYILNNIYSLKEEDYQKIDKNMQDMYQVYNETYGYSKEEFLVENNFNTEDNFKKYMTSDYLHELYYRDFLKKRITDKDIKKYYDKNVFGEKKVYMFSSGNKSDLSTVESLIKKGKSFDYIKKNAGEIIGEDLGYVDFRTKYDEVLINTVKNTKKGKFSSIFEIESYGYAIVYVEDEKKVLALDELKDDILDRLADKMDANNSKLYYKAFIDLRKEYDLKIYDTDLKKRYEEYKKSY